MLPRGYKDEPRPKPEYHRFKVPIPSRVVLTWNGRTTQRIGYIVTTLDSNPTRDEPQPTHRPSI